MYYCTGCTSRCGCTECIFLTTNDCTGADYKHESNSAVLVIGCGCLLVLVVDMYTDVQKAVLLDVLDVQKAQHQLYDNEFS